MEREREKERKRVSKHIQKSDGVFLGAQLRARPNFFISLSSVFPGANVIKLFTAVSYEFS
jgi:hypothetical protein